MKLPYSESHCWSTQVITAYSDSSSSRPFTFSSTLEPLDRDAGHRAWGLLHSKHVLYQRQLSSQTFMTLWFFSVVPNTLTWHLSLGTFQLRAFSVSLSIHLDACKHLYIGESSVLTVLTGGNERSAVACCCRGNICWLSAQAMCALWGWFPSLSLQRQK